jgi:hypothetical protein
MTDRAFETTSNPRPKSLVDDKLKAPRRFIITYGESGSGGHNSGGLEKFAAETHAKEIKANQFPGVPAYASRDVVEVHLINDVPSLVEKIKHAGVIYWAYFGHSGPWAGGPKYEKWKVDKEAALDQFIEANNLYSKQLKIVDNLEIAISDAKRKRTSVDKLNAELINAKSKLPRLKADAETKRAAAVKIGRQWHDNQNNIDWYAGPGALFIAQGSVPKGNLTSRGLLNDAPATDIPKKSFLPEAQVRLFGCRGGWAPNPIAKQIKDHLGVPVFAFANTGGSIYTNDKALGHGKRPVSKGDTTMKLDSKKPIWMIPINGKPEFKKF